MILKNALQLSKSKGSKSEQSRNMSNMTQPIQFLEMKDKDEDWRIWNMDWFEHIGIEQIKGQSRRLLKNYKLANGIIDKTDYIVEEDNETAELIQTLVEDDDSAFELKFFPIIPNVINVLEGEFAKRNDKITYRAVDEYSYNEMLAEKGKMVEDYLMQHASQKMQQTIEEMGLDMQDEQQAQQAQQMMSEESLKSLPEIEEYFTKDYRSMVELWASHQHNVDYERFRIKELEVTAFGDMLRADREFWHFEMRDNDYEVQLWNPLLTFYHKSPDVKYVSQGNWVGKFDMMSISDVIDKYGYLMNEEELNMLEEVYPVKGGMYLQNGVPNDGNFYDPSKSHDWNSNAEKGPGLAMRQHNSFNDMLRSSGNSGIDEIFGSSESQGYFNNSLFRITTSYWKSQKKIGHLTYLDPMTRMMIDTIVDETFIITDPPVFDKTVLKEESRKTLIAGEYVEWIWINETWGGIKIGSNTLYDYSGDVGKGFSPIYLKIDPLRFQFKGDHSLYGCKLPVEGAIFSDRNTKSSSLVDKMKPFQIGYNLVNNQIADILIDEIGTVVMLDQNALPKHSLGEDWGKDPYANAFVAMKDFQMLPLDTSLQNTEGATNFNNYQVLNLEQTNRLMSRVSLANHFKQQCFETIGMSPQRMGAVNAQETATGVEQAINMSYSQTDMYFVNHSEYLMPRVHQMRTDLSQYYHSTNPSVRLQYITGMDEKVNFEINGTDLLLRDLNVFVSTKINQKQLMQEIKSLALNNNTSGATVYDLGDILKSDSMAELDHVMKEVEKKAMKSKEAEHQKQLEIQQQQIDAAKEARAIEVQHEDSQSQLERDKDVRVAEIRAASATGLVDINKNEKSDYIDTLNYLDKKAARDQKTTIEKERNIDKKVSEGKQINLKREDMRSKEKISKDKLAIAKQNKNKYDFKKK